MSKSIGYACYVRVRTKAHKRDEFVRLIKGLQRDVRANEPDTLVFELLAWANPDEFVFFEAFTDQSAQQRHQNAPYHQAMSAAGWACLDGEPAIEMMQPL